MLSIVRRLHAGKNETFTLAGAEPKRCPGRYLAGASLTLSQRRNPSLAGSAASHIFLVTECLIVGRGKYSGTDSVKAHRLE